MALSGAWKARYTRPDGDPPRVTQIDPEHANPVDPPDPTMRDLTGAPQLPTEWAGGQYEQLPVGTTYVDRTPEEHAFGVGDGGGRSREEAQAIGGAVRAADLGAVDERRYVRPKYQETPSSALEQVNGDNRGDSPATLEYDRSGVGNDRDPYARSNRAVRRTATGPAKFWRIDWTPSPRPRYVKNAQGSRERPMVVNRTQYVSDAPAGVILRPDNWARPIVRRAAQPQDFSSDDLENPGSPDFGLGSWGL